MPLTEKMYDHFYKKAHETVVCQRRAKSVVGLAA